MVQGQHKAVKSKDMQCVQDFINKEHRLLLHATISAIQGRRYHSQVVIDNRTGTIPILAMWLYLSWWILFYIQNC